MYNDTFIEYVTLVMPLDAPFQKCMSHLLLLIPILQKVYRTDYAHELRFVVFGLVTGEQIFYIIQGYLANMRDIIRLLQCNWSNPSKYG